MKVTDLVAKHSELLCFPGVTSQKRCGWDSDLFSFFCGNTLFHLSAQPSFAISAPANFPFTSVTFKQARNREDVSFCAESVVNSLCSQNNGTQCLVLIV